MDAKAILYAAIDKIGKDRLRSDLVMDFRLSDGYIARIIGECLEVAEREGAGVMPEDICEALLHFLLTALLIPSERKISIEGIDADILIPSSKVLKRSPDKALLIQVMRPNESQELSVVTKLSDTSKLQPVNENIWLVANNSGDYPGYRVYSILPGSHKFSTIIIDIMSFLDKKGVSTLKLVHG